MRLALLLALAGASLSPAAVVVRAALIFPALATDGPVCDAAELSCPPRPSPGSSWDPFACVPFTDVEFDDDVNQGFATLAECATLCRFVRVFDWRPLDNSGTGDCWCDSQATILSTTDCGLDVYHIYTHTAAAAASGLAKRQQDAMQRLAEAQDKSVCPPGLTACRVLDSDDGYECLDTDWELESCGGCRHGVFQPAPAQSTLATRAETEGRVLKANGHGLAELPQVPSRRAVRDPSAELDVIQVAPAPAPVGFDCSDAKRFGPGLTCRKGACVPVSM